MWKKLLEIVREVFDLRQSVKGHDKRLDSLTNYTSDLAAENRALGERVPRLELKLESLEKQQANERDIFRLQLENLILRSQRGLPPSPPLTPLDAPPDKQKEDEQES